MKTKLKAVLALILALTFVFSAAACTSDPDKDGSGDASDTSAESTEGTESHASSEAGSDTSADSSDGAHRDPNYKALNYDVMKGIWISQYDTAVFAAGEKQRDKRNYEGRVNKICKAISESGFNTVILQVRPFGDSYYPSEYYCPSAFVVGRYGREFTYDPLKIFVDTAHKYNLSMHAWINPLRLMTKSEIKDVSTDYVIGQWYQDEESRAKYLSLYKDRYYLVPGFEETRKLIIDGATEICRNYNVDAIHIDDYFYPTADPTFDAVHYNAVKDEFGSLATYRREKINQLVYGLHQACKAVKSDILFGISPAGSIQNNMSGLYADVRTWGSRPGFCDYLAPQIYWGFEHPDDDCKFDLCYQDWEALCTEPSVKLVVGLGIYRANRPSPDGEFAEFFSKKDVIKRQLEYIEGKKNSGFIMYSYVDLFDNYGRETKPLEEERENFLPVMQEFGKDK